MPADPATRRTLLTAAVLLGLPTVARAEPPTQLTIGGGLPGDAYYILGGGIAAILNRDVPGMSARLGSTDGGVSNVRLLDTDRSGLGFCQADTAVTAFEGSDRFNGRPIPVRALAVLYANRMQVVINASGGIQSFADLRGKRVSTGAPGSATETMAFRLLAAAGVDRHTDLATRERLNLLDSCESLRDNELDAFFISTGAPNTTVRDLADSHGMKMALVDHAALAERVIARYGSVYFADVIPAGTYPGQQADNAQVSVANILLVLGTMPNTQAAAILAALWKSRAELAQVCPEAQHFTLAAQKSAAAGIPWHPAAEAFWKTQGADLT